MMQSVDQDCRLPARLISVCLLLGNKANHFDAGHELESDQHAIQTLLVL
jgi:hypothetical protein